MSPNRRTVLHSTSSLFYVKPRFVEHLLQHNILEPTVGDGSCITLCKPAWLSRFLCIGVIVIITAAKLLLKISPYIM